MRTRFAILGTALLLFGFALFGWILYDATQITVLLGIDPMGGEAIVVVAGLTLAAAAVLLGLRTFYRGIGTRAGA